MIDKLIHSKYLKPKRLIGINCEILADNSYNWRYCILQQAANKISVVKTGMLADLADLKKEKLSLVPVYLTIDGKGIINKKIKADSENAPILQVIPNATVDDFYYSETESEEGFSLISVMRTELLDHILALFSKLNFQVVNVHVGSFHIARLREWFKELPDTISSLYITIHIDPNSNKPAEYKKTDSYIEEDYTIAGETVSSLFISPFAAALLFFLDEEACVYPAVQKSRTDFLAHRLFVIGGWGLLIMAFLTLLINYIVYMQYSDKTNALDATINGNNENMALLENLKAELKQKEVFLGQSGFGNKSRFSFFTDEIASTIPPEINLMEFSLNPLLSKVKKEKAVEIRKDVIVVKGQSPNSIILNDWIKVLESFKWIKKIAVMQYAKDQGNRFGEFELEIELENTRTE